MSVISSAYAYYDGYDWEGYDYEDDWSDDYVEDTPKAETWKETDPYGITY